MSYQQPERFALMQYQCEKCAHLEMIWNSRNAVTPFTVACGLPGCDGVKSHINWPADRPTQTLPAVASRVFVSITSADAERIAEARWVDLVENQGLDTLNVTYRDAMESWIRNIYGDGGRPMTITRAEYQQRQQEASQ